MSNNYKLLIDLIAKLSDDYIQSLAENLPLIFDTFSETTSVVIPLDNSDYISLSAVSDVLSVSTSSSSFKLSSTETQLFLTMIKSY